MSLVIKDDYDSVPCVSAITKSLEPLTGQMSNVIAAKLTAVEATLKENVTKVVKSKVSVFLNISRDGCCKPCRKHVFTLVQMQFSIL